MQPTQNSTSKNSKSRNLIAHCCAWVLQADRQNGFIPMMIALLLILIALIAIVFMRVQSAQG